MRILVTGASGNLGMHVARHLLASPHELRLLVHQTELPTDLASNPKLAVARADLARIETLQEACAGIDCIVQLAGVLFAPLKTE